MSLVNISIDLSKIDKSRIVEKGGAKYISLTVASTKDPDKYGNTHTVYHRPSKEENEKKAPKVYCGNGKEVVFNNDRANNTAPHQQSYNQQGGSSEQVDDLPF